MSITNKLTGLALAGSLFISLSTTALATTYADTDIAGGLSSAFSINNSAQFSVVRTSEYVSEVSVAGAKIINDGNDIKIISDGGTYEENISFELQAYDYINIEKIDNQKFRLSISAEDIKALDEERVSWKCALGTLGTEIMAGTAAIIGLASAPATLGTGAAAGLIAGVLLLSATFSIVSMRINKKNFN